MNTIKKAMLALLVVLHLYVINISSLPTPKEQEKTISKRQTLDINDENIEVESDYNDDINERIVSIADTGSKIIENLISTLSSSAKIISDLFEAKLRIAEPLLENTERILNTLNDTKSIEKSLETVQGIAEAGIKTSIGISSALSRSSKNPVLSQGFGVFNEVAAKIVKISICQIICPLQKGGDNGDDCEEQFCGGEDSSDKLDDYEGDYEGDYVDTSNNDV